MYYYVPYVLRSRAALNALTSRREYSGVLLRRGNGYACLQSWPELGDAPLAVHLDALRRNQSTPLLDAALECLESDGRARENGRSLFEGLNIAPSHYTLAEPDLQALESAADRGFAAAKIKISPASFEQVAALADESPVPLRLDANCSMSRADWDSFFERLGEKGRAFLDFIEDPMPYDARAWHDLRESHGMDIAADRPLSLLTQPVDVTVWKPSARLRNWSVDSPHLAVTSNMDHPLGQLYAAWHAATTEQSPRACGLATHLLFDENEFSEILGAGPVLRTPAGTGLGFDELLDKLPWTRI